MNTTDTAQLTDKATATYFREHHKTVRSLCKTMGMEFSGSAGHEIFRTTDGTAYAKYPFTATGKDGREQTFELFALIQ